MDKKNYADNNNYPMDVTPEEIIERKKAEIAQAIEKGRILRANSISPKGDREDREAFNKFLNNMFFNRKDAPWKYFTDTDRKIINRGIMQNSEEKGEKTNKVGGQTSLYKDSAMIESKSMAELLGVPEEVLDDYMFANYPEGAGHTSEEIEQERGRGY